MTATGTMWRSVKVSLVWYLKKGLMALKLKRFVLLYLCYFQLPINVGFNSSTIVGANEQGINFNFLVCIPTGSSGYLSH